MCNQIGVIYIYSCKVLGSLSHESSINKLKCYRLKRNTSEFLGVISEITTSATKTQCPWSIKENYSDVPQGSLLVFLLCTLFTNDTFFFSKGENNDTPYAYN